LRYLSVSDVTFSIDAGDCDQITQDGPGRTDNTAQEAVTIGADPPDNVDFALNGINITIPVGVTTSDNGSCVTSPDRAYLNTDFVDSVDASKYRGRVTDEVQLGHWKEGADSSSAVQQLFTKGPTTTCENEIPHAIKHSAGSCTLANTGPHSATETATIRWDVTTTDLPVFHVTVVSGNHQSVRPRHRFKSLTVRVVEPDGTPVPQDSGVRFRVKNRHTAKVVAPAYVGTVDHGFAYGTVKAGNHTGPVVVAVRADGANKAAYFHLRVHH
jgi:hypothetical protein